MKNNWIEKLVNFCLIVLLSSSGKYSVAFPWYEENRSLIKQKEDFHFISPIGFHIYHICLLFHTCFCGEGSVGAFTVVLTEVVRISKLSSFFLNMCFKKVFCSFCLSQEKKTRICRTWPTSEKHNRQRIHIAVATP